jgi:hypothetical protein
MPEVPADFVPTAWDLLAHKIDRQFPGDVALLGEWGRQMFERLVSSYRRNEVPEKAPVIPLLLNGLTTATAALELWRRGLLLQVGILVRNALETVATTAVITSDKSANERYQSGRYRSAAVFSDVKKTWPVMGATLAKSTGFLSEEFVHGGESYRIWLGISPGLTDGDVGNLRSMLLPVKVAFYVIDLLSEVVCWEMVSNPRYWERVTPSKFELHDSPEGREWMERCFKETLPKVMGP